MLTKKSRYRFTMKKITHQYGTDIAVKFDSTEKIHFVEDCSCYLGVRGNTFSIVCDYRSLKETFKIKQTMLVEYEFDTKEECLKFIQDMIFIAPYDPNEVTIPKSLQ